MPSLPQQLSVTPSPAPRAAGGPTSAPPLHHRRDVDGLRGVAVLAVLAYHLGVGAFRGGFVGVDVFFVISGYLITGILLREMQTGRFSLLAFYRRRVRRLLPAYALVVLVTLAASALVLFEVQAREVRTAALWASVSASNIHFWQTSDYFARHHGESPLLHTWSLAVEEQYYLVLPFLLLALRRFRRRAVVGVLAAVTLASFALSTWWVLGDQAGTAFYLLPSRAWELGAGALLAAAPLPPLRRWGLHLVSLAGLGLVLLTVVALPSSAPFPGPGALAPVLGAVALIWAGESSWAGRALSCRPLVFVGAISYSLYLWHWPVIVLWRAWRPSPQLSPLEVAVIALVSVGLAVVTWRWVEQPARRWSLPTRRAVVGTAAALLGVTVAAAVVLPPVAGAVHRPTPRIAQLLSYDSEASAAHLDDGGCFQSAPTPSTQFPAHCLARGTGQPQFLLLGDSLAADLASGVRDQVPGVHLLQATASGCEPVVDGGGEAQCRRLRDEAFRQVVSGPLDGVDGVVLSARWTPEAVAKLPATVRELRQHVGQVVVVGPHPLYESPLPELLARQVTDGPTGLVQANLQQGPFTADRQLAERAEADGYRYVSLISGLCATSCRTEVSPGVPLQFDHAHLTAEGSDLVASDFLRPALTAPAG